MLFRRVAKLVYLRPSVRVLLRWGFPGERTVNFILLGLTTAIQENQDL